MLLLQALLHLQPLLLSVKEDEMNFGKHLKLSNHTLTPPCRVDASSEDINGRG